MLPYDITQEKTKTKTSEFRKKKNEIAEQSKHLERGFSRIKIKKR